MAKIQLDPMPQARINAIERINFHFANAAGLEIHRERAWQRKREIALAVQAGSAGTPEFSSEATRRGLDGAALAVLVLSKPDPNAIHDAREEARQVALSAAEAASGPDALIAIIEGLK